MAARSGSARKLARVITLTIDVVLFTPQASELSILLVPTAAGRTRARDRWTLPTDVLKADETLDDTAMRIARESLGSAPSFLDQAGASAGGRSSADRTDVTIVYFGLAPNGGSSPRSNAVWVPTSELVGIASRPNGEIQMAIAAMRARVDQQPIAFRLLPHAFTLSELQGVYELLLGRRLHKASFRRSLHAAALVEATDEWRSEGRGRPAQLFRYVQPRRRRQRRGIRFDLLN